MVLPVAKEKLSLAILATNFELPLQVYPIVSLKDDTEQLFSGWFRG